MSKEELCKILKTAGKDLNVNCPSAAPLRDVHRGLLSVDRENKSISFMAFFLLNLIDKIFFNVTGNVKWIEGVTDQIQNDFLRNMGINFSNISDRLVDNDYANLLDIYEELSEEYLNTISKLNDVL